MPVPRLHVPVPLRPGSRLALPERAVRHVQVLRLQPGDAVRVFDGRGPEEWEARIESIGKRAVEIVVAGEPAPVDRELGRDVRLAVGMPANDRMDALVEKATELGAAGLVPLVTARSVLRLEGERAASRQRHWQAIAEAAAEQCGRSIVPAVEIAQPLAAFLRSAPADAARVVLSLRDDAVPPAALPALAGAASVVVLSGPEGGLAPEEEDAARETGFAPVTLGTRTLRADTAPLALLAWLAVGRGASA